MKCMHDTHSTLFNRLVDGIYIRFGVDGGRSIYVTLGQRIVIRANFATYHPFNKFNIVLLCTWK